MLVLYYYNWNGSLEEMYKYEKEAKKSVEGQGMKVKGMYTPTCPWNRVWLIETDSVDKLLTNSERAENIRNTDLVILL